MLSFLRVVKHDKAWNAPCDQPIVVQMLDPTAAAAAVIAPDIREEISSVEIYSFVRRVYNIDGKDGELKKYWWPAKYKCHQPLLQLDTPICCTLCPVCYSLYQAWRDWCYSNVGRQDGVPGDGDAKFP
jgi:hypothetical protein